jgi:hypothetical protein
VSSGELQQLTSRPNGVGYTFGTLNPEGTFVYYHQDQGGNEIGHYVRIPYKGGGSLTKDPPEPRTIEPPERGRVIALPQVGGLHPRYERLAA